MTLQELLTLREQTENKLVAVNEAIDALRKLEDLDKVFVWTGDAKAEAPEQPKKRQLSEAQRLRISEVQKKRWRKWRKARKAVA